MNIERSENTAKEIVGQYLELEIGQMRIRCPYYMNVAKSAVLEMMVEAGVDGDEKDRFSDLWREGKTRFGRFQGKGNPGEIASAAIEISEAIGLPVAKASPDVAINILLHLGLGIDCSGLVFNVLKYVFEKDGRLDEFMNSLDWQESNKRNASRAGAFVFAGKASRTAQMDDLRPLDLLLFKSRSGRYNHIALILDGGVDGRYAIAQSTIAKFPSGVDVSGMKIDGENIIFEFVPGIGDRWEKLFIDGRLEFRRLRILE